MKRIGRRKFAKGIGMIAAMTPLLSVSSMAEADAPAKPLTKTESAQRAGDAPAGAAQEPTTANGKLILTSDQQSKLRETIGRRDAQLAQLHARELAYDLEPAFAFRVRQPVRPSKKP